MQCAGVGFERRRTLMKADKHHEPAGREGSGEPGKKKRKSKKEKKKLELLSRSCAASCSDIQP